MSEKGAKGAIIFPDHLFRDHPSRQDPEVSVAFLVEDDRFFSEFRFHKKKLLLLRASIKHYGELLEGMGLQVEYLENRPKETLSDLFAALRDRGIETVRAAEIVDHPLRSSLFEGAKELSVRIEVDESPGFLTPMSVVEELFRGTDRRSMASFYRHQRRRLDILMKDGRPVGGRWSYDSENRKRLPTGQKTPSLPALKEGRHVREAKEYVEEKFPDNPGSVDGFNYPTTHEEADLWLADFLERRLAHFGDYEDAMKADDPFLFHSLLSSSLNAGLLTPREVLDRTLEYAGKANVPINSLEGFIRQIIGWREFMRAVYIIDGEREKRSNFWGHHEKIPPSLYSGTTGIEPLDRVVSRALDHAYAHHIERLMVLLETS